MPLIPKSGTVNANINPMHKPNRYKDWVKVGDFAFSPDKVEGFLHEPEHFVSSLLIPAVTRVFFGGYAAVVDDSNGELYRFLLENRKLI